MKRWSGSHQRLVSAVSRWCGTRTWGRGQKASWPLRWEEFEALSLFYSQKVKPKAARTISYRELIWDSLNAIHRLVSRGTRSEHHYLSGDREQISI